VSLTHLAACWWRIGYFCSGSVRSEIINPLKTEGILKNFKKWYNSPKSGRI
jgi:hypothetical protein